MEDGRRRRDAADGVEGLGVSGAKGGLPNLGYPVGAIDGKHASRKRLAVTMFESPTGLAKATGDIDEDTKQTLVEAYEM